MKRRTVNSLFSLFVAAIFLSSCSGLNKMKKAEGTVTYKVTPSPLEMHANEVQVTIDVNYPAKFFNKKAVVKATPVLKYEKGETAFDAKTFQGESVEGNDIVVKYAEGGKQTYTGKITYTDDMMKSELVVNADAWLAGKESKKISLTPVKIADGVNVTPKLVMIDPKPIMMSDKYVRTNPDSYTADLLYVINRYDVRTTETKKDEVKKLQDYIKSTQGNQSKQLKGIEVSAYASPDGPVPLNTKLSGNRQGSASDYLKKELKKAKITDAEKNELWKVMSTPEDWDGFKTLMEKSNIKDKELVLRVLSMYSDPDVREKEIKNISKTFEEIARDILPQLRRAKITASADVVGRSDDEILAANLDDLGLEELLYGGNLSSDLTKKLAFYQKASEKYPDCVRAKNNVGYTYFLMGKYADAKTALEAAKAVKDLDVVKCNLASVALVQGDLKAAEEGYTSSMSAGDNANYGLGTISIINGKYENAVKYFGSTNSFNAALAKLLFKQTDAAIATLNAAKSEDAKAYYLMAILGARTEKPEMIFSNLRIAVGKDAALKEYAKKDVEFFKYFADETFKSIVQ
jgi:tetratricopeptide (TPR) repeat protein